MWKAGVARPAGRVGRGRPEDTTAALRIQLREGRPGPSSPSAATGRDAEPSPGWSRLCGAVRQLVGGRGRRLPSCRRGCPSPNWCGRPRGDDGRRGGRPGRGAARCRPRRAGEPAVARPRPAPGRSPRRRRRRPSWHSSDSAAVCGRGGPPGSARDRSDGRHVRPAHRHAHAPGDGTGQTYRPRPTPRAAGGGALRAARGAPLAAAAQSRSGAPSFPPR